MKDKLIILDRKLINYEFSDIKDVIFLNVASVVMLPRCVQNAYFDFTKQYIKTFGNNVIPKAWEMIKHTRKNVAKLINAESSEIAFVKNTTEGIGIIANGLPLSSGNNVIVVDQEHPANLYTWINLQEKGVELRVIKSRDDDIFIKDIIDEIDKNTRAITISAVQFSTGIYTDLVKIGNICRENNIIFIVDGIQAIGRLSIDVKRMNINYLACGGNKGLLATPGAGFVYCDSAIIGEVTPVYACYQSVQNYAKTPALTTDFSKVQWYDDARRLESGNLNYAGIAAINAGVQLINKLGIKEIESYIIELEDVLIERIKHLGFDFRTPSDKEKRSGILCIYYPQNLENELQNILDKYDIYATNRGGYIRLSIDFYNTKEQMIKVGEAFKELSKLIL